MTNWLNRVSDAVLRVIDGPPEYRAAMQGFGLNTPNYQLDKPRWMDPNIANYRKAFASQVAVYACILARARAVSSAPVRVYQEQKGDRRELPDHPLRLLMANPNPMMSEAEFLVMTQTLMDATGFAAIEKVRANAGNVVQLWHLRSDWLKEIRRSNQPSNWEFRVPGRNPVVIRAEDILIIPGGPATDLGTVGMSPIAVALREIGIDAGLTDFLKLFIESGGTPRYALVTPNQVKTQQDAEDLRAKFGMIYGGFQNWTKTVLLHGGLDYKTIGSNIEEFAYPQLRALTETHICSVFGVPPIVAGIQAGIDASTYSNYEQARKAFFEDCVQALWSRLDGALTRGLLSEFTDDRRISLEFDVSGVAALRDNQQEVWTRATSALGGGGITLNQYQAVLGFPGFGDAGDVLYLPISAQPTRPDDLVLLADETIAPPQPVPAALTDGGGDGSGADTGSSNAGSDSANAAGGSGGRSGRERVFSRTRGGAESAGDEDGTDEPSRGVACDGELLSLRGGTEQPARDVRILTLPLETRARIATNNRRNVSRLTAKFTPRLRAMFRRHGEIVANAYKQRALPALDEVETGELEHRLLAHLEARQLIDIDWAALDQDMVRELAVLYETAGRSAFGSAGRLLGAEIDWSLANPRIRQTLNTLAQRIVGINETTRKDVAGVVAAGLQEGLTTPQIAEKLTGLYEETYRNRSLTIARTESQVSYNLATADAYKQSGVVTSMQLHDNPNHVDAYGAADGLSCAERNGVVTDLDSVQIHVFSEHPNGTLAVSPLLVRPLGE